METLRKTAIRTGAAFVGQSLLGPFGVFLGSVLGSSFADVLPEEIREGATKLLESATEKFAETTLGEPLRQLAASLKEKAPKLEKLYRSALGEALNNIKPNLPLELRDEAETWFRNWQSSLTVPLYDVLAIPAFSQEETPESIFTQTLVRLDDIGKRLLKDNPTITPSVEYRNMAPALVAILRAQLPDELRNSYKLLITQPESAQAWKEATLIFRQFVEARLNLLPVIHSDLKAMRSIVESSYEDAIKGKVLAELNLQQKEEELERLTSKYGELLRELESQPKDHRETELLKLLQDGNFADARQSMTEQVNRRAKEAAKLPQDLTMLAQICELQFDWEAALTYYRQAWELSSNPSYGSKYALLLARLNRYKNAITVFEEVVKRNPDAGDLASCLNNLALVYRNNGQHREAESRFIDAISIFRDLFRSEPQIWRFDLARALNNLVGLFLMEEKLDEATSALQEACEIVQGTTVLTTPADAESFAQILNNMGYIARVKDECEKGLFAHNQALAIQMKLAEYDAKRYLPAVANTLNNRAVLFRQKEDIDRAEEDYKEALRIRRITARWNPESETPHVASNLSNLAQIYLETGRRNEAEIAALEAVSLLEPFFMASPNAFADWFAKILTSQALIALATPSKSEDASKLLDRALSISKGPSLTTYLEALVAQNLNSPEQESTTQLSTS